MRASISETIAGQAETISALPQTIQQAVLNATGWLTGDNGGYVIFRRNDAGQLVEQFISDSLDLQAAKNIWRWNLGGLGFSSNGINGPYKLAITQDGSFVADFITAGTLSAIVIQSLDGKSKWNLSTGEMDLYNTKITTSTQGSTYVTADYTEADNERLKKLILNMDTPTLEDYEKLDVDGNGHFGASDMLYIERAILGQIEINFTTGWKFRLDPTDGENLLKLVKTWKNNLTNEYKEHLVLGAGFGNVRVNALSIGGDLIPDYIVSQGVSDIWTYRKWASGVAECWGQPSKSVASSGTFLGADVFSTYFSLPAGLFTSVTEANVNPKLGSGYAIPAYINATNASIGVDALANNSGTQTFSAHISVKGKWK